jgi:hypothetical protein
MNSAIDNSEELERSNISVKLLDDSERRPQLGDGDEPTDFDENSSSVGKSSAESSEAEKTDVTETRSIVHLDHTSSNCYQLLSSRHADVGLQGEATSFGAGIWENSTADERLLTVGCLDRNATENIPVPSTAHEFRVRSTSVDLVLPVDGVGGTDSVADTSPTEYLIEQSTGARSPGCGPSVVMCRVTGANETEEWIECATIGTDGDSSVGHRDDDADDVSEDRRVWTCTPSGTRERHQADLRATTSFVDIDEKTTTTIGCGLEDDADDKPSAEDERRRRQHRLSGTLAPNLSAKNRAGLRSCRVLLNMMSAAEVDDLKRSCKRVSEIDCAAGETCCREQQNGSLPDAGDHDHRAGEESTPVVECCKRQSYVGGVPENAEWSSALTGRDNLALSPSGAVLNLSGSYRRVNQQCKLESLPAAAASTVRKRHTSEFGSDKIQEEADGEVSQAIDFTVRRKGNPDSTAAVGGHMKDVLETTMALQNVVDAEGCRFEPSTDEIASFKIEDEEHVENRPGKRRKSGSQTEEVILTERNVFNCFTDSTETKHPLAELEKAVQCCDVRLTGVTSQVDKAPLSFFSEFPNALKSKLGKFTSTEELSGSRVAKGDVSRPKSLGNRTTRTTDKATKQRRVNVRPQRSPAKRQVKKESQRREKKVQCTVEGNTVDVSWSEWCQTCGETEQETLKLLSPRLGGR